MRKRFPLRKKTAIGGMALVLASSVALAACSTSDKGATGSSSSPSPVSPAAGSPSAKPSESKEPLAIDVIVYPQSGFTPINGTEAQKVLEQKFNVKFNVLPVDISSAEKFNLYFAQGGTTDVMLTARPEIDPLLDQGLFREIKMDDLYSKMPTWMKKIDSLVGDPALTKKLMTYNGKVYSIPFTHGPLMESGIMIARKDWMTNVGITKSPTTLDEFEQMLKAFTEGDPDKNGKKDTYGIHGGQRYSFNYVWGAYGFMPKTYTLQNGKVTYTSILPEYKDALKLIAKWYKAGYIDPEFITDDRTKQRNKWSEGKFGVLADNAFWMDSVRGESGVLTMVEAKNPKAEFDFMSPFKGPTGKSGSFIDFPAVRGDASIYFGKKASDQVVAKMMEIKEALASDWELYKRMYYGVEGTDYTTEASGRIAVSPKLNAETITKEGIAHTFALMPITMDWMSKTMSERDKQFHKMSIEQPRTYNGRDFAVSGTNKSLNTKGADMMKVVDEFYFNAITGKVDIDATWDKYVDSVNKAGLSDILAEFTKMYNEGK
ncbi:MAG: hypothetical protein J7639_15260 [Paenibacillaceae bacterium]|nr:hypothetical protein [Paenibacillaceae bacterium]